MPFQKEERARDRNGKGTKMSDYIDRDLICYQLMKQATIDGQPRAIRRAERIVRAFPASDVRKIVFCKDCGHWDSDNQRADKTGGNPTAHCAWFSRQQCFIETSAKDYCSYGYERRSK